MKAYFSGTQKSSNLGGLGGPGGFGDPSKMRGASRPAFWSGFWGPRGGRQQAKHSPFTDKLRTTADGVNEATLGAPDPPPQRLGGP